MGFGAPDAPSQFPIPSSLSPGVWPWRLSSCARLQAALTPAGLAAGDGLAGIPPEPWLAVVAVPPSCVVAAPLANTPTPATRQPEQLGVEPAAAGVLVAGAG